MQGLLIWWSTLSHTLVSCSFSASQSKSSIINILARRHFSWYFCLFWALFSVFGIYYFTSSLHLPHEVSTVLIPVLQRRARKSSMERFSNLLKIIWLVIKWGFEPRIWFQYLFFNHWPACLCAKSLQSCLTLCSSMDFSSPGSSIHGILQARILKWTAMPSSRGSSWSTDWIRAFLISLALAGRFFTTSATWEGQSLSYSASILTWTPCEKHSIKFTLPNQTWICSPACSKANLLTPNYGGKKVQHLLQSATQEVQGS